MASNSQQISMRGFAEVAAAAPKRKLPLLKRFKFPTSEESVGRANYYVKALSAIKRHHKGETTYVSKMLSDLAAELIYTSDPRKKAKLANNHRAITEYLAAFGHRRLAIQPGKALYYVHNGLAVSARPDIVAEENGELVLIKLNLGKDDYGGGVTSLMVHVLYEAAIAQALPVLPIGIQCLQVCSGSKITGPKTGFGPKRVLDAVCDEVLTLWPAA